MIRVPFGMAESNNTIKHRLFDHRSSLEANSETMGHKSVPVPSYALSERSRLNPGLGTTVGSTLLFSITARFGDIKQQSNCLFSFSYSIQITI